MDRRSYHVDPWPPETGIVGGLDVQNAELCVDIEWIGTDWKLNDRAKPTQKNKEFRNSARSSMLPCSLGLTGRDLQGGTVMEAIK